MAPLPPLATLFRLLLGGACVLTGLVVVWDPGLARSVLTGREPDDGPGDVDPERPRDRTAGDEDGRARAAGGLLFVVGVTLLLGQELPV